MVVINFDKQIWHPLNDVNEEEMELCAGAAVEFDKNGQRYLNNYFNLHICLIYIAT